MQDFYIYGIVTVKQCQCCTLLPTENTSDLRNCKFLLMLLLVLFISKLNPCVPHHSSAINVRNIVETMQWVKKIHSTQEWT
jgi:hypothetical protein